MHATTDFWRSWMSSSSVLVTGAAGFIGAHVCRGLVNQGYQVVAVDNLNDYYDPEFKLRRFNALCGDTASNLVLNQCDIADTDAITEVFQSTEPDVCVNLAAQAGVRHSIAHPQDCTRNNLVGFANILECCTEYGVERLIYASSSSVYGNDNTLPFAESDRTEAPASYYAATKKANEAMAAGHGYVHDLETIGLRYFTVYGPWGRPDMAPMLFGQAILEQRPITLFDKGILLRDFTYIDDVVAGTISAIESDKESTGSKAQIYNLGNNSPVPVREFLTALEQALGVRANVQHADAPLSEMRATAANIELAKRDLGFAPRTQLAEGLAKFAEWLRDHHAQFGTVR